MKIVGSTDTHPHVQTANKVVRGVGLNTNPIKILFRTNWLHQKGEHGNFSSRFLLTPTFPSSIFNLFMHNIKKYRLLDSLEELYRFRDNIIAKYQISYFKFQFVHHCYNFLVPPIHPSKKKKQTNKQTNKQNKTKQNKKHSDRPNNQDKCWCHRCKAYVNLMRQIKHHWVWNCM